MNNRLALLLAFLLVLGCSQRKDYGSPDANLVKLLGVPGLAGSYSGTWTADNKDTGTITFQIDPAGNLTGEEREDGDAPVGKISGTVDQSGELNATCHYEGYRPDPVTGHFGENVRGELIARVKFHHQRETVEQVYFLKKAASQTTPLAKPPSGG